VRLSSAGNEVSAILPQAKKRSLNAVARVPDSSTVLEGALQLLLMRCTFAAEAAPAVGLPLVLTYGGA
jgi:hypothetical protein